MSRLGGGGASSGTSTRSSRFRSQDEGFMGRIKKAGSMTVEVVGLFFKTLINPEAINQGRHADNRGNGRNNNFSQGTQAPRFPRGGGNRLGGGGSNSGSNIRTVRNLAPRTMNAGGG